MKAYIRELTAIIDGIQPLDHRWIETAAARTAQLVMPTRALGRLHEIAEKICGMRRSLTPTIDAKAVLIMAGDHGVVDEGVSAYPQDVTGAMVQTFLAGGAGINAIARHIGARVRVVDLGIKAAIEPAEEAQTRVLGIAKIREGTANIVNGPAMSREEAQQAVISGYREACALFEAGAQILVTGDMGIGNTTPSAAIGAVVTASDCDALVGRGTGVDDAGLRLKRTVVRQAIEKNRPDSRDGLDVLSKVGGFEIGGIAGSILAAAHCRRPVVIDGFISTAGALIAHALCPTVKDYMFAGHRSQEPGHGVMLEYLGLEPLLDLGMRLGEGSGAALALAVIEGALKVFKEVLTFDEAGVPDK